VCWAIPGKVIEVEDLLAKVDFGGNVRNVVLATEGVREGDIVLVHAGVVISRMSQEEWDEEQRTLLDLLEGKE
jgi:hydrogenase expression/formation protein HypC